MFCKRYLTLIVIALGILCAPAAVFAVGFEWTGTQLAGSGDNSWQTTMSADSTTLLAGAYGGRVYLSRDGGATWDETRPAGDTDQAWISFSASGDGTVLFAGTIPGRLYLSTNSGTSWSETRPAGDVDGLWIGIAVSQDGSTLLAGNSGGRLYLSTTAGASWSEVRPAGDANKSWQNLALSSDGTNMLVSTYPSGRLYISTTTGATWMETRPLGDTNQSWINMRMSADGSVMLVGIFNGRLYVSTNGGTSWGETQPAGNVSGIWSGLAVSPDGTTLLAGNNGGRLSISTTTGAAWMEIQPAGDTDQVWSAGAEDVASDNETFFVSPYGPNVYLGHFDDEGPVISSLTPEDDATGILASTDLTLTFDEDVATTSGAIVLKRRTDDEVIETFTANSPLVTIDDNEVNIDVTPALEESTPYYVTIDDGMFEDLLDNAYAGISDNTTWNFTTAAAESAGSSHRSSHSHTSVGPVMSEFATEDAAEIARLGHLVSVLKQILDYLLGKTTTLPMTLGL